MIANLVCARRSKNRFAAPIVVIAVVRIGQWPWWSLRRRESVGASWRQQQLQPPTQMCDLAAGRAFFFVLKLIFSPKPGDGGGDHHFERARCRPTFEADLRSFRCSSESAILNRPSNQPTNQPCCRWYQLAIKCRGGRPARFRWTENRARHVFMPAHHRREQV